MSDDKDRPFVFGDSDPEDAWQADDPPAEQIRNIIRRLVLALEDLRHIQRRVDDG